jgi:ABC-type multidrug transport system fused ATPase/permease subunit
MSSLSVSLRQKLADTEHFDLTELMGSLDSRSSFAATRLTGREKVQQEKFAVVMGRWQRNQLKIRSVEQLTRPIINMMRTFAQMAGYYFGGFMVAEGTITPADLVTFVDESQDLVNSVRMWISTWSEMYKDRRDPILLARFNAVVPTIGLTGSRRDGHKYVIPKTPPSEFIWTIECKDVAFW